jgi:hypothetical protein
MTSARGKVKHKDIKGSEKMGKQKNNGINEASRWEMVLSGGNKSD